MKQVALKTLGATFFTFIALGLIAPLLFSILLVLASPLPGLNSRVWEEPVFVGFPRLAALASIVTIPLAILATFCLWGYSAIRGRRRQRGGWYCDLLWVGPVAGVAFSFVGLVLDGDAFDIEKSFNWYVAGFGAGLGSGLLAIEAWYRCAAR